MYDSLIVKMRNYFSDNGLILYSKANDYSKITQISLDEIEMYYDILCSDEIIPPYISRDNHKMCCLYYLAKEDDEFITTFEEKYLKTIDAQKLGYNEESLVKIFNLIEFEKSYLNSPISYLTFLYSLLKQFTNLETNLKNCCIYRYYRGYFKLRFGDLEEAHKTYFELVPQIIGEEEDFMMKYIKLLNDLFNIKINKYIKRKTRPEMNENIQFLTDLFNRVKVENHLLALKIGFELFSAFLDSKEYHNCLPILTEMKKILKKALLKGSSMKNGIDYYLAIISRISYVGILLNDKKSIEASIKKIKKALVMIGNNNKNKKLNNIFKTYFFFLATLEIQLTQRNQYDIRSLAAEFRKEFLPNFNSNAYDNDIITEKNKESIIINLKIINNEKNAINKNNNKSEDKIFEDKNEEMSVNKIFEKNYNDLTKSEDKINNNYIIFLVFIHNAIYESIKLYLTDVNGNNKEESKYKIKKYFKLANDIIKKNIVDPFFQTNYAKNLIINIYFVYLNILILEKDFKKVELVIDDIMDNKNSNLRSQLNIDENTPNYGLWLKIKGDYYIHLKHYEAAIFSYEKAIKILDQNNPKIPLILFNCGCSYYFIKNKNKAIDYLNRCINSFAYKERNDNYFGLMENPETVKKKIETAKKLVKILSNEK